MKPLHHHDSVINHLYWRILLSFIHLSTPQQLDLTCYPTSFTAHFLTSTAYCKLPTLFIIIRLHMSLQRTHQWDNMSSPVVALLQLQMVFDLQVPANYNMLLASASCCTTRQAFIQSPSACPPSAQIAICSPINQLTEDAKAGRATYSTRPHMLQLNNIQCIFHYSSTI